MVAGRCRNRIAAGLVGLIAGAVLYLGYYHVGLVHMIGMQQAHRIDLLPTYIDFRVHTDVVQDAAAPQNKIAAPNEMDVILNWIWFGSELCIVLGMTTLVPVARAGKPYCEHCDRWMTEVLIRFPADWARPLAGALATDTLAELVQGPAEPGRRGGAAHCRCAHALSEGRLALCRLPGLRARQRDDTKASRLARPADGLCKRRSSVGETELRPGEREILANRIGAVATTSSQARQPATTASSDGQPAVAQIETVSDRTRPARYSRQGTP